jgi:hypothetical protein
VSERLKTVGLGLVAFVLFFALPIAVLALFGLADWPSNSELERRFELLAIVAGVWLVVKYYHDEQRRRYDALGCQITELSRKVDAIRYTQNG